VIVLLTQAAPPDAGSSGGALAAYVALGVSVLGPLIAALSAWASRKTRHERMGVAKKDYATGEVIATGSPLEWRTTDHQALLDERGYTVELRKRAGEAEERVRNLRDKVADQDRKIDAITEDLRQLRISIAACPGGPVCPLNSIPRRVDPTEPHERSG
jgi:hypothetical protein